METGLNFIIGMKKLPKTLKENWIPIVIMLVLWMIPAVFVQLGKDPSFLKPLNFLTAGKSGIVNPNLLQMLGGISSKSLVLTFLIGTVVPTIKGRKFNGIFVLKSYFLSLIELLKKGLKGMGLLLIGAGVALVLHGFMSTDFTVENSFVSIIGMLYAMSCQKTKISGIQGLAPGFLASFAMTYFSLNTYVAGAVLLVIGGVMFAVSIFSGKTPKQTASLILSLMLLSGIMVNPAWAETQYNEGNPGVELVLPNAITAYEPFEVVIRITNPDVKKQIDRIEVMTSSGNSEYIIKPAEDADGKNYNGEDEVKFSVVVNEYISEPRKLDVLVFFKKLYKDSSGTRGEGVNLWLSQGITQQTQVAKLTLPSQFAFKQEGNNPFTNSFNYVFNENVDYTKANFVGFGRSFQIQMHTRHAGYYMPNGPEAFDMIAYGLEETPENSQMVNAKTMEAPQSLLDTFGASKGALILYENHDTRLKSNSTEILMDLIHLNYFFYYLKGNTIFQIWGEADDGIFEASVADIAEVRKKELYDACLLSG